MKRTFPIIVMGEVDRSLHIKGTPLNVHAFHQEVGENASWILCPEGASFPELPGNRYSVRYLREAVRFAESLEARVEDLTRLLSQNPFPAPSAGIPLQGEVVYVTREDVEGWEGEDWQGETVSLYAGETVARLWGEGMPRWLIVDGPAGSGKSTWLRHVEGILQQERVPVLRVEVGAYAFGDRPWAEEIARATGASRGVEDGPAISLLVRWLKEGMFRGGLLILDGVEETSSWQNLLNVLEGLVREWRGWVVIAGRHGGVDALVRIWRDGRNVLPPEVLWLRVRDPSWEEVLPWLPLPETERRRFRRWYEALGMPLLPGMLNTLLPLYREKGLAVQGEVYEHVVKEGIRKGPGEAERTAREEEVEILYLTLARALAAVVMPAPANPFQELSEIPHTFTWDDTFARALHLQGSTVGGRRWNRLKKHAGKILVRGLHRAGVWSVMGESPEARVIFEDRRVAAFLMGLGCRELWGDEPWENEWGGPEWSMGYLSGVLKAYRRKGETPPWWKDEGKTALLGSVDRETFKEEILREARTEDPEKFLVRLQRIVEGWEGFRGPDRFSGQISSIEPLPFTDMETLVMAWIRDPRLAVRERVVDVLTAIAGESPEEVWNFVEAHPEEIRRLLRDVLDEGTVPGGTLRLLEVLSEAIPERVWAFWESRPDILFAWMEDENFVVRSAPGTCLRYLAADLENVDGLAAFWEKHLDRLVAYFERSPGPDEAYYHVFLRRLAGRNSPAVRSFIQRLLERLALKAQEEGGLSLPLILLRELARGGQMKDVVAFLKHHRVLLDRAFEEMTFLDILALDVLERVSREEPGWVWEILKGRLDLLESLLEEGVPSTQTTVLRIFTRCVHTAASDIRTFWENRPDLFIRLMHSKWWEVRRATVDFMRALAEVFPEKVWNFLKAREEVLVSLFTDDDLFPESAFFIASVGRALPGEVWKFWAERPDLLIAWTSGENPVPHVILRFDVLSGLLEPFPEEFWSRFGNDPAFLKRWWENTLRDPGLGFMSFLARIFPRTPVSLWQNLVESEDASMRKAGVEMLEALAETDAEKLLQHEGVQNLIRENAIRWIREGDGDLRGATIRLVNHLFRGDPGGWSDLAERVLAEGFEDEDIRPYLLDLAIHMLHEGPYGTAEGHRAFLERYGIWILQGLQDTGKEEIWSRIFHILRILTEELPSRIMDFWESRPGLLEQVFRKDFREAQLHVLESFMTLLHTPDVAERAARFLRKRLKVMLENVEETSTRFERTVAFVREWIEQYPETLQDLENLELSGVLQWILRVARERHVLRAKKTEAITPFGPYGQRRRRVEVVWGDPPIREATGEIRIGSLTEKGVVEVEVRWRPGGSGKDVLRIRAERNPGAEKALRRVWREFRKDVETPGYLEVDVDAGDEQFRGSVLFGVLLGLALAARKRG